MVELLGPVTRVAGSIPVSWSSAPPLPVPQLEVGCTISLQDTDGVELLDSFLVIPKEDLNLLTDL